MVINRARAQLQKLSVLAPRLAVLAVLAAVIVTACVIMFNKSLGWFAQNKEVDGDGMSVSTNADTRGNLQIDGAKYDLGQRDYVLLTDNFAMNEHDTIFTDRNTYTPLVLRVKIDGGVYTQGQNMQLVMVRDTTAPATSQDPNKLPRYISSVVDVRFATDAQITGLSSASTAQQIYTTVRTYFETGAGSSAAAQKFTTLTTNPDSFTKVDTLSFNFTHTSGSTGSSDSMYVYFYLTYDDTLMNRYIHDEGTASVGNGLNSVYTLDSDIEYIGYAR